LESIDRLQADEVLVVSQADGVFLGELIATAIRARRARGMVLDCWIRDALRIIEMELPTFVRGINPVDSLGRLDVTAMQEPIVCGGVLVCPGDLILGDFDGVVVIPHAVAEEAISKAEEKAKGECIVREFLAKGNSVVATYRKVGVI
jgi:4-hydroxy-4-methyl-2-oxoglutarate aldolase